MSKEGNTEGLIMEAAKKIFLQKGLSGSRMQDIADEAGINKALLHYYFRSKDKLFDQIFREALETFLPKVALVMNADLPLFEKIERFVQEYITVFINHPHIPLFVLHEISQNPERMVSKVLSLQKEPLPFTFMRHLQTEISAGRVKPVSPIQFFIHMLALCVFPFAAKPMIQGLLQLDELQYRMLLEQRKTEVSRILIDMLKLE